LQTRPLVREGAPQKQERNFQTGSNIWSQVPQGCSIPWHTDWLTVSHKVTLTSTFRTLITLQIADPPSRQRGRHTGTRPQIPGSNIPTGSNIWSQVLQGCSIQRRTYWLTVSHKVTSNVQHCYSYIIIPSSETCWARSRDVLFFLWGADKPIELSWVEF
jgi:hypothetical protein